MQITDILAQMGGHQTMAQELGVRGPWSSCFDLVTLVSSESI